MKSLIEKAKKFARLKHKGQLYGDKNFFQYHPLVVYKILQIVAANDYSLQCAGLLHDVLEDTETTYEELVEAFDEDIASLVQEVSKEGYNYFPNLKTQRGVILKFADRLSNVSNMFDWGEERKRKYLFEKSKFWKEVK